MEFGGLVKQSLWDYPGLIVATVSTQGCNFRCPFCHNHHLIPFSKGVLSEEEVLSYLESSKEWLDGVCITGGEPTLQPDLKSFIIKLKNMGFKVKLDTNGTNPHVVQDLINERLVDYIAMDVKAPLTRDDYSRLIGRPISERELNNIKQSISLIFNSGVDYEFRTTVVPGLLSEEDVVTIASSLPRGANYVLQQFIGEHAFSPDLKQVKSPSSSFLHELAEKCNKYVHTTVRVYI